MAVIITDMAGAHRLLPLLREAGSVVLVDSAVLLLEVDSDLALAGSDMVLAGSAATEVLVDLVDGNHRNGRTC